MRIGIAGAVDLQDLSGLLVGPRPTTPGYAHPITNGLIRALLGRGHEVVVYALSRDPRDIGTYSGPGLTVEVCPFRERLWWGADLLARERASLVQALDRSPCDVVHAHWTYEFAMAALASGIPSVVTVRDWGPAVLKQHRHPYRVARLAMQWHVLRNAPLLTANSPYTAEKIKKWYRRDVPIVPNGIVVPDQLSPRTILELDVIGSVNNGFGKRKNVQTLLAAFTLLRGSRPHASLRLVGTDYEPGGPASDWARKHDLDRGVEFVGPVRPDEIPAFMRSIDVLVHPSLEESFGMTPVEAIVQGTPVIGGAQSGAVPWVLGDGEAGTLVDVTDPHAICDAILGLPDRPAERDDRRQRALEYVRDHFSLDSVVDRYEDLYREAVANPNPSQR